MGPSSDLVQIIVFRGTKESDRKVYDLISPILSEAYEGKEITDFSTSELRWVNLDKDSYMHGLKHGINVALSAGTGEQRRVL